MRTIISDRAYLPIVIEPPINQRDKEALMEHFNTYLNQMRAKYHSMFLTNYREGNRKRIDFKLAYLIIGYLLDSMDTQSPIAPPTIQEIDIQLPIAPPTIQDTNTQSPTTQEVNTQSSPVASPIIQDMNTQSPTIQEVNTPTRWARISPNIQEVNTQFSPIVSSSAQNTEWRLSNVYKGDIQNSKRNFSEKYQKTQLGGILNIEASDLIGTFLRFNVKTFELKDFKKTKDNLADRIDKFEWTEDFDCVYERRNVKYLFNLKFITECGGQQTRIDEGGLSSYLLSSSAS